MMEQFDMVLDFDDVAEYVHGSLIELGYVPTSDETLAIADIMFNFIIQLMAHTGAQVTIMEEEEE